MKTLIALIFLVFIYDTAFSQNEGVELYFGISGSMLRGDTDKDFSRRNSVQGGFLFLVPITESFFGIKTGLGYSGRGALMKGKDIKLNYAEVPLLFSLGSEKFDFFIGPQLSFLIGSNTSLDKTRDAGIKYGVSVGLGENLFAHALFYHGFSNVVDDYYDIKVTNRYIGLVLGYRIVSKKVE